MVEARLMYEASTASRDLGRSSDVPLIEMN
jgi:hypothetical protein